MGWIDAKEQLPPEGLEVLVEASGIISHKYCTLYADHDFYIAMWIHPVGEKEGNWTLEGEDFVTYEVHAWMPLPEHYQAKERFGEEGDDLFEHALFEDKDPDYLYKGKYTYEQMSLDDFLKGAGQDDRRRD